MLFLAKNSMVATNDKYAQEIHDIFFRDQKSGCFCFLHIAKFLPWS